MERLPLFGRAIRLVYLSEGKGHCSEIEDEKNFEVSPARKGGSSNYPRFPVRAGDGREGSCEAVLARLRGL